MTQSGPSCGAWSDPTCFADGLQGSVAWSLVRLCYSFEVLVGVPAPRTGKVHDRLHGQQWSAFSVPTSFRTVEVFGSHAFM